MENPFRATVLLLAFCGTTAQADVSSASSGGFVTANEVIINADRTVVWIAAVNRIGQWWSSDHTVSGDASRLSIATEPLGCFCEQLDNGGSVVHLTVTMINPAVIIRLTGGLGPLGLMGVNGNMTWEFEDTDGATRVRFTYAVGGYRPDGLDGIADPVDAVIAEALARLKNFVETGEADSVDAGRY